MTDMIENTVRYYLEKLYVLLQTVAYTIATIVVVVLVLTYKNNNAPFYTAETDYLHWVTRVPAFTICPSVNGRYISNQLSKYSKAEPVTAQNISFFMNLVRPKKQYCPNCPVIWPGGLELSNIRELMDLLIPACEAQLLNCTWNGRAFPCCRHFQPLVTKRGVCYSLNSEQTRLPEDNIGLELVTSHLLQGAELSVEANTAFSFHIHHHNTVNMLKPKFIVPLFQTGEVHYKFSETLALESAWELSQEQRRCILSDELTVPGYKRYSYTACRNACLREKQQALCGCSHHFLMGNNTCPPQALKCLDDNSGKLSKIKCNCLHRCEELEIQIVYFKFNKTREDRKSSVSVILTKPPTERTVMYAQTSFIETIVGFACLSRLITTANLYECVLALCNMVSAYASIFSIFRSKATHTVKKE